MYKQNRCGDFSPIMENNGMGMPKTEMKDMNMGGCSCEPLRGIVCQPVYECPQERVCHREIVHEVPQV